jgi:hypothetical protein
VADRGKDSTVKGFLSTSLLVIGVILMSTGVSVTVNAGSVSLATFLCTMLGGFVFAAGAP